MGHFLVTYHHATGDSEVVKFGDALEAFDAFDERERLFMGDDQIEVVLLSAEHETDLHKSHPNFFAKGDLLPA